MKSTKSFIFSSLLIVSILCLGAYNRINPNYTITGVMKAGSFIGDGSGLTGVGGAGSITGGSNLSGGIGIVSGTNNNLITVKALVAGTGIGISSNDTTVTISSTATNLASYVQTNWVLNQIYSNTSGNIQFVGGDIKTTAAAATTGTASFELMVDSLGGTAFVRAGGMSYQTTATTVGSLKTNSLMVVITNGATYYLTNNSFGAGNSSSIIAGTGTLTTLGGVSGRGSNFDPLDFATNASSQVVITNQILTNVMGSRVLVAGEDYVPLDDDDGVSAIITMPVSGVTNGYAVHFVFASNSATAWTLTNTIGNFITFGFGTSTGPSFGMGATGGVGSVTMVKRGNDWVAFGVGLTIP